VASASPESFRQQLNEEFLAEEPEEFSETRSRNPDHMASTAETGFETEVLPHNVPALIAEAW
jgi:hypothetical protein